MFELLEGIFEILVKYGILVLEAVGAVIIIVSAFKALVGLVKGSGNCRLELAEGVATALSFLLGGEALKTIIAPDWHDIGMTGVILLMRAAMSVLIHWETKVEMQENEHKFVEANKAVDSSAAKK